MSDIRVTYDGDTHWLECIPGNANSILIRTVEPGDSWEELAQEVAEHQAQHGCAPEPVPAEQAAPCDPEPKRFALVEQMGHRSTTGTVREVTFAGTPMIEVTDLRTGSVHLVSPSSLYEVTWLDEEQARQRVRPWTAQAITAGDLDDDEDDGSGPDSQLHEGDWDDAVSEATS